MKIIIIIISVSLSMFLACSTAATKNTVAQHQEVRSEESVESQSAANEPDTTKVVDGNSDILNIYIQQVEGPDASKKPDKNQPLKDPKFSYSVESVEINTHKSVVDDAPQVDTALIRQWVDAYQRNNPHLRKNLFAALSNVTIDSTYNASPASCSDSLRILRIVKQKAKGFEAKLAQAQTKAEKDRIMTEMTWSLEKFSRTYPKISIGYGFSKLGSAEYLEKYPSDLYIKLWDKKTNSWKYLIFHY